MVRSKIKNFLLVGVAVLGISNTYAAVIDEDSFSGVDSLLIKLKEAGNLFVADKIRFQEANTKVAALTAKLDARDDQRKAVMNCLNDSYTNLLNNVKNCHANKEKIREQGEIDKRDLINKIDSLRKQTSIEIDGLNTRIEELNRQIESCKLDIATLTSLTSESVNEALTELEATRGKYASMKLDREVLLANLNDLIVRTNAYNSMSKEDMLSLHNDICEVEAELDS